MASSRATQPSAKPRRKPGLLGVVARKPLGRYRHVNGNGPCRVDVYLMRVTDVLEHWLEDKLRRRRWMRIPDAAACLRKSCGSSSTPSKAWSNWIPDARWPAWASDSSTVIESIYRRPGRGVSGGDHEQPAGAPADAPSSDRPAPVHRARHLRRPRPASRSAPDPRRASTAPPRSRGSRRGGGNRLTLRLTQPVSFAWDLPDGPLQQALAPVIGVRRLLAAGRRGGVRIAARHPRRPGQDGRTPADRVGPRAAADVPRRLAAPAHRDHADGPARLRRRLRATRAGDRKPAGRRVVPGRVSMA